MANQELEFFLDQPAPRETEIKPGLTAVTVITYYPDWYAGQVKDVGDTDKIRGDLFFQLAQRVQDCGYHLVVANARESSDGFKQALADLENITVVERPVPDRVTGSLMAIEAASQIGAEVFFCTQAEKVNIVPHIASLVVPFSDPEVKMVKGRRTQDSLNSYPQYMANSEEEGNFLVNYMLHQAGILPQDTNMEWFFGVTAFRNCPEIMEIMETVYKFNQSANMTEAEKLAASYPYAGAGTSIIPEIAALVKGLGVEEAEVDFQYSQEQRKSEEDSDKIDGFKAKRRQQRLSICARVWNFLPFLKGENSLLAPLTLDTDFIRSVYASR